MLGKLFRRESLTHVKDDTHNRIISEFGFLPDGTSIDGTHSEGGRYSGGMNIPAAWRSAILLSDLLGGVPWHAFRTRGDVRSEKVDPNPLILEQPNPPDTRMNTYSSWALDLLWHGNAIGVVATRNSEGWPTSFVPVPAWSVGIGRNTATGAVEYLIGNDVFGPQDVLHIKGPAPPGSLRGMGVLETQLSTLNLAHDQRKQAQSLANHGVPTGLLKSQSPDLTPEEASDLKNKWLSSQDSRTIAVLNATTDFEPLSWSPEELMLVEARKFSLHELALIFGVPLSFLGVEKTSRTYSNDEMESINLVKFSMGGHLSRFEQALSLHLPHGTEAKANLDWVLRADTLTRYQAHKTAIEAGFLTANEVRQLENREPLEDE